MKPRRPSSPHRAGVPGYMTGVYDWVYVNPRSAARLDHDGVVRALLLGRAGRLIRAYLEHITPGARVWQAAHVYGSQIVQLAQHIGPNGFLQLTDVTPVQIERARHKLAPYLWSKVDRCDAARFTSSAPFDAVGSFFLLHEVPESKKRQIVDNMLRHVAADGKAVFIDYHRPAAWHPARPVFSLVNATLEPFARALWQNEISAYATRASDFDWSKRTFFGGVYQCTIARHKGR
jgi:ubiquinone/menaquinone biosynthesis C-methylase UbiE